MSLENQMAELSSAVRVLTDHLQQVQQLLAKGAPVPAAEPAPEPKAKPAAKAKAEPAPEPKGPTKDDVIAALKALQESQGANAVKALLHDYGARNVGGVPADKFADVIAAAEAGALEDAA